MNRHQFKDLTIKVFDEPTYQVGSSDNCYSYSKLYFGEEAKDYSVSKHGVKVCQGEHIVNDCIITGSGGATTIHKNSSLLDNDQLLICCSDTIFCLTLPDLSLKWKSKADQTTCFQIYKQQDHYITHGEQQISKFDKNGNVIWEFCGADIFVSIDNEDEFIIQDDGILLTDFTKTKYKLDFEGRLI